jgi:signal transduction histidine kinase
VANVSTMLIVDDEPRMTESAKAALDGMGFEIETSNCSTEALTRLKTENYDVALLDVRMPGLTGYQILDALQQEETQTECIIMTGDVSLDTAIEAIRRGASDYVRKPFDPDELLIRVNNAFKKRQLKAEHQQVEVEKLNLERQLRQSQKLEAIGTLAGGIAHDFNNVLSIILGNTELACAVVPEGDHVRDNLEKILIASNRAREMINQLLSFTRKTDTNREPLELNTVVTESLKLLRASLPTNILIRPDMPEVSFVVQGDSTQIHQIMINLCTNAAHAMEDTGGVLEVKLGSTLIDPAAADGAVLKPGSYVSLTVSDTGRGIDPEICDRIFDPYFTTKDSGKGTGMGLAVVHGIVKSHGGAITVFSEPNVKTAFQVLLPIADAAAPQTDSATKAALPTGRERILLVDDEEMVVDIVKQMVQKLGYMVDASTDSRAALKMFQDNPKKYDLVVTDQTMPNLTGKQLGEAMREIRPEIPIILCSGFNENVDLVDATEQSITEFAKKPMGMEQLAKTIRSVLDRRLVERRQHPRFTADSGAFVILQPNPTNQCKLLDVSLSGLSFSYYDAEMSVERIVEVTIRTADNGCSVSDLSCETMSEVATESEADPAAVSAKRRGVQFRSLTPVQVDQLRYFIQNNTSDVSH